MIYIEIFLFGCMGTAIRLFLLEKSKEGILLANIFGVMSALVLDNSAIITGFSGSLSTFSSLIKQSYQKKILTIIIIFLIIIIQYKLI